MTTKIFKPLKVLSRKHNVAVIVIHHMGKSEKSRPGQRMLGAVANHAWAEDSIYLSRSGLKDIRIDLESKTVPATTYRMTDIHNLAWTPSIAPWRPEEDEEEQLNSTYAGEGRQRRPKKKPTEHPAISLLRENALGLSTAQLAAELKVGRSTVHRQMTRLLESDKVSRTQTDNGSNIWKLPENA